MSRTYRFRKDKWNSKEIHKWHDYTRKHISDGIQTYWRISPRIKDHTNYLRRADDRYFIQEALEFGDSDAYDRKKLYKHLHWVYD